jgi:hypothetical protein
MHVPRVELPVEIQRTLGSPVFCAPMTALLALYALSGLAGPSVAAGAVWPAERILIGALECYRLLALLVH